MRKEPATYLPLSESTYFIMLSLIEPRHGYGVMQTVEELSEHQVSVGPGTLYGAFTTLEKEGLIVMTGMEDRRKYYKLTATGRAVLALQIHRLEVMARSGKRVLPMLES